MSNNNNMLHTEAVAHPQWSSFSCSNMLKTDLPVCEMGPSYLLDLSTGLKSTEVRVMAANNCSEATDCVRSKSSPAARHYRADDAAERRRQSVFLKRSCTAFTRGPVQSATVKTAVQCLPCLFRELFMVSEKTQRSSFRQRYLGLRLAPVFERSRVNVCQ